MESRVTQLQQADGIICLSAPVSGEKSLPPLAKFTVPARALDAVGAPEARTAALAAASLKRSLRVISRFIFIPPIVK
jgi:hypothetical protein